MMLLNHLSGKKKWSNIVDFDFSKPSFKWFTDAKLNITENCLDRHVETHPTKTAIIFEPNDPNQMQSIYHIKNYIAGYVNFLMF